MFITPAFAQGTAQAVSSNADMLMQILPFALIFVVFYFLLLRPQQIRQKQQNSMLSALKKGDDVVTTGGLIGTVFKIVDDNEVIVEFGPEIKVRVVRSNISALYTPPADMPKSKTKAS
jgi:preprotein translocase subunit YajC